MKFYLFLIITIIILSGCQKNIFDNCNQTETCPVNIIIEDKIAEKILVEPVTEFKTRITKKPFGIYITPENSPIQPERFQGFHTGVDVEYEDVNSDVPVFTITDGQIIFADWVNGYGGVVVIKHNIENKDYLVIYGHLNPDSLPIVNGQIQKKEQIGILGKNKTNETDGERKHLHFAIYTKDDLNLRGYVQTQDELKNWVDPLQFYP
ncbi:MAG: hypothetical protein COV55_03365 [Candidatus Komeilibacteria bacterium CG11_big_fil_rev_8_21_14_0_20_36_20]|uniref:M23ase beta-sheet core domain-containing protein n=1 Tax=Candidatus Komeilibacteria bacterium CG11_big_fil_rev_8_21_14_0_20_36_20 TaxID=1974477 RepID=A0A2H0NCB8_9BACT|nr:MAG: hypothetical protein COV55_03365 [Candidatus Komeilibacteria bacterium CG11_big_fil_rev_8_21_14_0_20_36_20]PIR81621.1 MAG: hypothetical protein COU21_02545 [Candidatus Komeilibacteria bacterium CG10_big_fil_rev_8_21_14_0_10_36_65]PJC55627.1 MAG: hypothetical protein CO027_01015 [Candidatus Komeilibacteria bacterium CG_4_9_14_0_2_um_filter_36_13]